MTEILNSDPIITLRERKIRMTKKSQESWGVPWDSNMQHDISCGIDCPNCGERLNDPQTRKLNFRIVGFSAANDAFFRVNHSSIGVLIIECQHCFSRSWFHGNENSLGIFEEVGKKVDGFYRKLDGD